MMLPQAPFRYLPSTVLKMSRVKSTKNAFLIAPSSSLQFRSQATTAKPYDAIPIPPRHLIHGNTRTLLKRAKAPGLYPLIQEFDKLFDEYGSIYRFDNGIVNDEEVNICSPKDAAVLFRSEGKLPVKSSSLSKRMKYIHKKMNVPQFMGFTAGNDWSKLRTSMSKQILPQRVATHIPALYHVADEVIAVFRRKQKEDGIVKDVLPEMQKWALKGATKFLIGEDLNVFDDRDLFSNEVCAAGVEFIDAMVKLIRAPPPYRFLNLKTVKRYEAAVFHLHDLGQKILQSKYDRLRKGIESGESSSGQIASSVLEQVLIEGKLTENEAISQLCDNLAAGVDTTSTTGTFMIHEVAKNPGIQTALREEISTIIGLDQQPTFEQLQNMRLVRYTVRETLRLFPPAFVIRRQPAKDIVLSGYRIPAGKKVVYNVRRASKDPDFFPNPHKFDPYRWASTPPDVDFGFASIPFGFGPRMCFGRRLAEQELQLLLIRLLQLAKLETDQGVLPLYATGIIQSKEPVRVKLVPW